MRYIFCTHSEKAVPLHRNSAKWGAERITNNQKNKCMKKLLIFALCLLGICNAHAEMMTAQEIILQFGDGAYVQIGEWEKDDYLSFKAAGYNFTTGNVGIGTAKPIYKLDVAGIIRAEELIVETTGADVVFADDYQLRSLSEVEAFISENKHLPEIQSAYEMQKDGVSVSGLQTQLLQKIEELTLYILQQEKRILALEAELKQ